MMILALEFSSEQRSVACARDGLVLAEARATGHSTRAMALIEQVLNQAGVLRDDIEGLVVGLGPGSYTGIRTAIAVAEGWHLVKGIKFEGISSVQCLAAQARAEKVFGQVDIVVDAQRGDVYHSRWEITPASLTELTALRIVSAKELPAVLPPESVVAGPEAVRWNSAGKTLFPTAAALCELAAQGKKPVAPGPLEPIYLRETSFVKAPPVRAY